MNRRCIAVAVVSAVVILLAGCTATDDRGAVSGEDTAASSLHPTSAEVFRCLKDKGWDVRILDDGGIEVDSSIVPTEQLDVYTADEDACWEIIDTRIDNMTTDQIRDVYQQELATRDCLLQNDFEVDEPPSEQQYIDSFQGTRWTAYGASSIIVNLPSAEEFKRLSKACPQPSWSLGAS